MIYESYYIKCTQTNRIVGSESLIDSTDFESRNGKKWIHFDLTRQDRKAQGLTQGKFPDSHNAGGCFDRPIPVIRVPFTPSETR